MFVVGLKTVWESQTGEQMPGKRLSAIFSDLDFGFLGCGNPVRSPDDEKYMKHINAPVKRVKEPYSSKLKKRDEEDVDDGKSIRERPVSKDGLLFDLELLDNSLKKSTAEMSLMDDIVLELSSMNPNNTLLKKTSSMPQLCICEEPSTPRFVTNTLQADRPAQQRTC